MSVRLCFACLKYIVFIGNFLFFLAGLVVLAVSGWVTLHEHLYNNPKSVYVIYILLLSIGGAVFITSFLGCFGSIKESSCLLSMFFSTILLLFLGEIVLGFYIYFKEESVHEAVSYTVQQTVQEKYLNNTITTKVWDIVQSQLECCGGQGPKDWALSKYNGFEETREIGIGSGKRSLPYIVPSSCCRTINSTMCSRKLEFDVDFNQQTDFYQQGCTKALVELFQENIFYVLLGGLLIVSLEIVGMILSLCLCTTIRKIEGRKN